MVSALTLFISSVPRGIFERDVLPNAKKRKTENFRIEEHTGANFIKMKCCDAFRV